MSALFAEAPALPLHSAGKYVAGAYIVFVAVILIYVSIMAVRLKRNQRDLLELKAELDERDRITAARELEESSDSVHSESHA
jgi:hypothetical protein